VGINLRGSAEIVLKVPRDKFTPSPNVDSAVVKIVIEKNKFDQSVFKKVREVVRCAFTSRRKMLSNNLINGFKLAIIEHNLFFCDVANARKSPINERIHLVSRLFGEGRIEIVESECADLINAFETAVWDEKHAGERLDIVGHDNPVDMLDAAEYSIEEFADDLLQFGIDY
jgi:hypothetical protein